MTLESFLVIHRMLCSLSESVITMTLHREREDPLLCTQRNYLSVGLACPAALPGPLLLHGAGISELCPYDFQQWESCCSLQLSKLIDSLLPVLDTSPTVGLYYSLWAIEFRLTSSGQTIGVVGIGWTVNIYLPFMSSCPLARIVENSVLCWKKLNISRTGMTVTCAIANALGHRSEETGTL